MKMIKLKIKTKIQFIKIKICYKLLLTIFKLIKHKKIGLK